MKKILFVCTGNTCRSPMAEGIFNKMSAEKGWNAHADSAGLMVVDTLISENSNVVCAENGIDISNHIPTQLTISLIDEADVILTMTSSHKDAFSCLDKVFTLPEYFGSVGEIADPYGRDIAAYRNTFHQLKELIGKYNED